MWRRHSWVRGRRPSLRHLRRAQRVGTALPRAAEAMVVSRCRFTSTLVGGRQARAWAVDLLPSCVAHPFRVSLSPVLCRRTVPVTHEESPVLVDVRSNSRAKIYTLFLLTGFHDWPDITSAHEVCPRCVVVRCAIPECWRWAHTITAGCAPIR